MFLHKELDFEITAILKRVVCNHKKFFFFTSNKWGCLVTAASELYVFEYLLFFIKNTFYNSGS